MVVMKSDGCLADNLRAKLSHRQLRTLVLGARPEDIEKRKRDGKTWTNIESLLEIEELVSQAKQLTDIMVTGFSPSQLLDTLVPLQELPDSTKSTIRKVLDRVYVEATGIDGMKKRFATAVSSVEKEFKRLETAWNSNNIDISILYKNILESARLLLKVLDEMPKGIVLP